MKEIESVTGSMGEGEAMTPAEETTSGAAPGLVPAMDHNGGTGVGTAEMAAVAPADDGTGSPPRDASPDPWQALIQVGTQLVAALATANDPDAPAHPWIVRDPATSVRNLKIPLPPPETARQLANALSALADGLRGRSM